MASRLRKRKILSVLTDGVAGRTKSARKESGSSASKEDAPSESTAPQTPVEAATNIPTASKTDNGIRLPVTFFQKKCPELARALLGKILARKLDSGETVRGSIVECEAYVGEHDKAAHSYKLKRTERNAAMFMEPGTVYVYHIYGMYTCINISSQGDGCAVLIRAIDPCDSSIAAMTKLRNRNRKAGGKPLKTKDLCSGPSKLTQAFSIDKATFNRKHICNSDLIWLESGEDVGEESVVRCARIGVDYAEEWAKKPLRYYVLGNESVSVRDKAQEENAKDTTSKYFS